MTRNKIEKVRAVTDQKVIQVTSDSKGIRYDVYVEDNNDIAYDVEMQRKRSERETGRKILFFNTKGTIKNISPEAEVFLEYIEKKWETNIRRDLRNK